MNKLYYYLRHIGWIKTLLLTIHKRFTTSFFCKKHKNIIFFYFPVLISFDMCLNKLRVGKFIIKIRILEYALSCTGNFKKERNIER